MARIARTSRGARVAFIVVTTSGGLTACEETPTGAEEEVAVTGVQITAPATELDLATELHLSATVSPPEAPQGVTWTSQDDGVAAVSADGVVEALTPGNVTITATSTADPSRSDDIELLVRDCPSPRVVSGVAAITTDTTWENWIPSPLCFDYVVTANVTATNGVLTIEPGTIVGFEAGRAFTIRADAGLVAAGTEADPIVLTGVDPERGSWDGLVLDGTEHPLNRIVHATIEYGGGDTFSGSVEPANLIVFHAETALSSTTLRHSAGYGLFVYQGSVITDGAQGLTSSGNAYGPVLAYASTAHFILDDPSPSLTANDRDVVDLRPDAVAATARWRDSGVPIRVLQAASRYGFDVTGELTITAGVRVEFDQDMGLQVSAGGSLSAIGTAETPVLLTGTSAVRGHWRGLYVDDAEAELDNVVIEYGGRATASGFLERANLILNVGSPTRLSMRSTTLRESSGYGLFTWPVGVEIDEFAGNTLTANTLGPAYVAANHVDALPDGTYTGNDDDRITVQVESAPIQEPATWRDLGVPYHVVGGVALTLRVEATSLTFEPGVELLFGDGVGVSVLEASLSAVGTAEDRVRFGAAGGGWRGFNFFESAGSFDYADIENGGSSAWPSVNEPANISITSAGDPSTVSVTANVTSSGAPNGTAFSFGPTIGVGCLPPIYIPPPDVTSDHCRPPGAPQPSPGR